MKKVILAAVSLFAMAGGLGAQANGTDAHVYLGAWYDYPGAAYTTPDALINYFSDPANIVNDLRYGFDIGIQYMPKGAILGIGGEFGAQLGFGDNSAGLGSTYYFEIPAEAKFTINLFNIIAAEALAGVELKIAYSMYADGSRDGAVALFPIAGVRAVLFNFLWVEAQATAVTMDLFGSVFSVPSALDPSYFEFKIGAGIKL